MIKFDNYESNLESILGNSTKMRMFSNYILSLPNIIKEGKAMNNLLDSLSSPDSLMFAVHYHDLKEIQKIIVTASFKVLNVTDNQDEFAIRMNKVMSGLKKDYQL